MKPDEARALRRRQDQARAARGADLETYLQSGESTAAVVPGLIPTEVDYHAALGQVRALVRRANRTDRNRRAKVLDDLIFATARLVFVERVCDMDRLARAALTPAALVSLSRVAPGEVQARMDRWQGSFLELS